MEIRRTNGCKKLKEERRKGKKKNYYDFSSHVASNGKVIHQELGWLWQEVVIICSNVQTQYLSGITKGIHYTSQANKPFSGRVSTPGPPEYEAERPVTLLQGSV
jgi:hypothetical protein